MSGERPHKCDFCDAKFKLKHHKLEHERRHTKETPYQCNKCRKKFTHSGKKCLSLNKYISKIFLSF